MQYLSILGNLGMQEMIVIFVIALLIFGPKNLPKLGKAMGHTVREFRDASTKMAESISNLDDEEDAPRPPSRSSSIPAQSAPRETQPAAEAVTSSEKK